MHPLDINSILGFITASEEKLDTGKIEEETSPPPTTSQLDIRKRNKQQGGQAQGNKTEKSSLSAANTTWLYHVWLTRVMGHADNHNPKEIGKSGVLVLLYLI